MGTSPCSGLGQITNCTFMEGLLQLRERDLKGYEDLAFSTRGERMVLGLMLFLRTWEGARVLAPEALSACARRASRWPKMPAHPLPGLERCGIF